MTSVANEIDPVAVTGLSGAEVGSLIELLRKVLNNQAPNPESHLIDERPAVPPTREVDFKGKVAVALDSLSPHDTSLSASHRCDQRTVWKDFSSKISSACQAFAYSRS